MDGEKGWNGCGFVVVVFVLMAVLALVTLGVARVVLATASDEPVVVTGIEELDDGFKYFVSLIGITAAAIAVPVVIALVWRGGCLGVILEWASSFAISCVGLAAIGASGGIFTAVVLTTSVVSILLCIAIGGIKGCLRRDPNES